MHPNLTRRRYCSPSPGTFLQTVMAALPREPREPAVTVLPAPPPPPPPLRRWPGSTAARREMGRPASSGRNLAKPQFSTDAGLAACRHCPNARDRWDAAAHPRFGRTATVAPGHLGQSLLVALQTLPAPPPRPGSSGHRAGIARGDSRRNRLRARSTWPRFRSSAASRASAMRSAARAVRSGQRQNCSRSTRRPRSAFPPGRRGEIAHVKSISWPTAEMIGTGQAATARTSGSSLKAHRSSCSRRRGR